MPKSILTQTLENNDFYILDARSPNEIWVSPGVYAIVLVIDIAGTYHFHLSKQAHLEVYGYFESENIAIFLHHDDPESHSTLHILIHTHSHDLSGVFASQIDAPNCQSHLELVNIVSAKSSSLDTSITINPTGGNSKANLIQKNIFMHDSGKVVGMPKLLIENNDVEARHSCGVERINPEHLVYLMSRGLNQKTATSLLILGHFQRLFSCLKMVDDSCYESLKTKFLEKIG